MSVQKGFLFICDECESHAMLAIETLASAAIYDDAVHEIPPDWFKVRTGGKTYIERKTYEVCSAACLYDLSRTLADEVAKAAGHA